MSRFKAQSTFFAPKKSLGQNFLISKSIRAKIMNAAGDLTNQLVIEIGPGRGFLTQSLLQAGATVIAIEKDPRAIKYLNEKISSPGLTLINNDILHQNLNDLVANEPFQIIANIPYNITGRLLRTLWQNTHSIPTRVLIMVQKEIADKICCHPRQHSLLSLSVRIFADCKKLFTIPPAAFRPMPKIHSAMIMLTTLPVAKLTAESKEKFFWLIKVSFIAKRKQLHNTLWKNLTCDEIIIAKKIIDPSHRPESITLEQWIELAKKLSIK